MQNTQDRWQAILVPMGKDGYDKGDIIRVISTESNPIKIAQWDSYSKEEEQYWQAHRLIIIDTEAEILVDEWQFDPKDNDLFKRPHDNSVSQGYSKVIASYPTLPNTIPLSNEFVTDFCESGEGSRVKVETEDCGDRTLRKAANGYCISSNPYVECDKDCINYLPKLNPDNTLAISLVKEERNILRELLTQPSVPNPYNCHKANAGECKSYPQCGCTWSMGKDAPAIDNAGKEDEAPKKKIKTLAGAYFTEHPEITEIYETSDRLLFYDSKNAHRHATTLQDNRVVTIKNTDTPATSPVDMEQMAKECNNEDYLIQNVKETLANDLDFEEKHLEIMNHLHTPPLGELERSLLDSLTEPDVSFEDMLIKVERIINNEVSNKVLNSKINTFSQLIKHEIINNRHKGDIFSWEIEKDFPKWLYEFEYHKAKLIAALMANDDVQKIEYSVDLSVYLLALINRNKPFNIQKSSTLVDAIPLPNIVKGYTANPNKYSEEDMKAAWNAMSDYYSIPNSPDFDKWITMYKNENK